MVQMPSLLAKRHYNKTGTLRWFEAGLVSLGDCRNAVLDFKPKDSSAGKFLLVIPTKGSTEKEIKTVCCSASELAKDHPVAVGFPQNFQQLFDLASEFIAVKEVVKTNHELEGDAVARRELRTRLAEVKIRLEEELRVAFIKATWYVRGNDRTETNEYAQSLSRLVSKLVDETFKNAPIIQSELINRVRPSVNGRAATRKLLYQMAKNSADKYLAIEGFKAEYGLYSTILVSAGLHIKVSENKYEFRSPNGKSKTANSFKPVWTATEKYLKQTKDLVPLSDLYEFWMSQPYGIRQGVLPVLAMSFILAKKDSVVVYAEEMFQYEINDYVVDILLQDPSRIKLRQVNLGKKHVIYLKTLAKIVEKQAKSTSFNINSLSIARELVRFAFSLPAWTKRTMSLSKSTQEVRNILLHATDPYQLLFVDLPAVFGGTPNPKIALKLAEALRELSDAYPTMLADLRERMLNALGHIGNDYKSLHDRAETVYGLTGDLQLDAFSTRLLKFGDDDTQMESIASLSIHKPPRDWSDRDAEQSALALADFALRFRHAEMLANIKGRDPTRYAVGIVFGTGNQGRTTMKSFDVSDAEEKKVQILAKKISKELNGTGDEVHLVLAAIAHVGAKILENNTDATDQNCKKKEASP